MVQHLRSLGLATLFVLTPLTIPVQLSVAQAQTTPSQISEVSKADRLLQEANQLAESKSTLLEALPKYRDALGIYQKQGNPVRTLAVRQKFEAAFVAARPLLSKQEQEIRKASNELFKRYPAKTTNDTAKKLKAIAATKLGFALWSDTKSPSEISKEQAKAYEAIRKPLDDYLKLQARGINQPIPENLRSFLATHAVALKEVQTLLLTEDIPQWEMDLTHLQKGDITVPLPSFLGLTNLNKLLLLDTLDKFQQYKNEEGIKSFDAAWRLRLSLNGDPRLISQLVNLIIARSQVGVIRNLDGIPLEWQKRLRQFDHAAALLTSIEMESFAIFAGYNEIFKASAEFPITLQLDWGNWSTSMRQDYWRWLNIYLNQSSRRVYAQLPKLDACNGDIKSAIALETTINNYDIVASPSWVNQWVKGKKMMLQLELTEKVLGVREAIAKSKLPKSIPSALSVACPSSKWNYSVMPEKVTISLSPTPDALTKSEDDLAYSYTISIKAPRE
ncbi:hypothetical protein [Tumidithrix helvetica]|uniref:hypothetical protein n=1 Tax=Tumidithrix helvetica TaxID=3457545 RepID=UPI003CC62F3D